MSTIFDITTKNFADNLYERAINIAIIVAWGFMLVWVAANLPTPENWGVILIFVTMYLLYLFAYLGDFLRDHFGLEKQLPIAVIGVRALLTKSILITSVAIVASYWFGYFLVALKMGVAIPQSIGLDVFTDVIYKGINSPIGEEFFFRAFLIPTIAVLIKLFTPVKNFLIALGISIFISAIAFAITHNFAYGANIALMTIGFVWGIIAGIMLILFGILATIAFHGGNNLPLQIGKEAAMFVFIIITIAIALLNVWILTRIGWKKYATGS